MVTRSWPVLTLRPAIAGPLLRYGLRFYGTDLLGTLSAYIDQIIILPMLSPAAVGIYVVARSLSRTLSVLSDAVASVLFPSVAGKNAKAIVSMVFQTLRVTALINFVLAASLAAMAPLLLHLVYGERFAAAATPLRILLGASLFTNSARILYQVYNGSGRPGIVTIIETVATALGTGLTIAFVPGWGTAGVATALLLASLVRLALALGAMQQVTGVALNFGGFLRGGAIEDQLL
jgi:O-antigen/teichoic acid export membrane protein